MYSYDGYGWLSTEEIPNRQTSIEPPAHGDKVVGQPYPNWTGVEWVLVDYVEPVIPPTPPTPKPTISKVTFLKRLTSQEFKSIRQSAKNDGDVDMFMFLFEQAGDVNLEDPDTVGGVQMLVAKGILTQQRADAILA